MRSAQPQAVRSRDGTGSAKRRLIAALLTILGSAGAPAQDETLNPIALEARAKGLKGCVPILNRITNRLIDVARYGGVSVGATHETKDRLFSVLFSRQVPGTPEQLVSVAISPDRWCSATIEITSVWDGSCEQVAGRMFASYPRAAPMIGSAVMLSESPTRSAYLLPLDAACLSIQKETLFHPNRELQGRP
jgi:hypothetical protein